MEGGGRVLPSCHPRSSHRSWREENRRLDDMGRVHGGTSLAPAGKVRLMGEMPMEGDRVWKPSRGGLDLLWIFWGTLVPRIQGLGEAGGLAWPLRKL